VRDHNEAGAAKERFQRMAAAESRRGTLTRKKARV
jgi:hypothetical protein